VKPSGEIEEQYSNKNDNGTERRKQFERTVNNI
jgi:hypothetical protein